MGKLEDDRHRSYRTATLSDLLWFPSRYCNFRNNRKSCCTAWGTDTLRHWDTKNASHPIQSPILPSHPSPTSTQMKKPALRTSSFSKCCCSISLRCPNGKAIKDSWRLLSRPVGLTYWSCYYMLLIFLLNLWFLLTLTLPISNRPLDRSIGLVVEKVEQENFHLRSWLHGSN